MAKKKKKVKKTEDSVDILSLGLIAFGVILGVIVYSKQEAGVGSFIKDFVLGGIFGKLALALPVFFVIMGIYVVFRDYSKNRIRGIFFVFLLLLLTSLVTSFDYPFTKEAPASSFFSVIGELTSLGTRYSEIPNAGGGFLGSILAVPLISFFGIIPARIIIITLMIVFLFIVTGIAFSSIIIGIREFLENSIEKGKNGIEEHKARRQARALEEQEEEEIDIPIKSKKIKDNSKKRKFEQIKEQTEVIDSGRQISISELGIDEEEGYEEEQEDEVEEEEVSNEEVEEFEDESEDEEIDVKPEKPKGRIVVKKPVKDEKPQKEEAFNLEYENTETYDDYEFPPISLLNEGEAVNDEYSIKELREVASKLQKTLTSFNVDAKVVNVTRGPTVTQYEVQPNVGVKVSKILGLADDIALNLAAKTIRIEAPIPGKSAVGIEVPNKTKETVYLREVIDSDAFREAKSKVSFALGKSIDGEPFVSDIAKMPHMLIAGSTGSGKSVCINSILVSLLYKAKPNEVKLILIDPKVVELGVYNGIPHLLIPVVTDPKKAAGALNWAVQEMVNRYNLFAAKGVRDIRGYNELVNQEGEDAELPQIVIIVDELADLMMVAPSEVEDAICRLAQMARAAGMHLIIATQRPSVDVVTGIIKANIPSRIAFTVSSQVDSRTILDMGGAEKLLGKGDMLYFPIGESKPIRVQGTYISDKEIEEIIDFIKDHCEASYNPDIIESFEKQVTPPQAVQEQESDADELLTDAIELAVQMGNASASMIQRKFKVGYARAGRIIDQMEERGIVSGYDGSKPRQTLISKEEWEEMKEAGIENVRFEPIDEDELIDDSEGDEEVEDEDEVVYEEEPDEEEEEEEYQEDDEDNSDEDDEEENEDEDDNQDDDSFEFVDDNDDDTKE